MMTPEQLAGIRSRAADFYLSYRESGGELHAAVDDVNALLADRAELEADLRTVIAAWDRRANTPDRKSVV